MLAWNFREKKTTTTKTIGIRSVFQSKRDNVINRGRQVVERVGEGGGEGVSQSSVVLILSVNDWRTFRGQESSSAAAVTGFSLNVVRHGRGRGGVVVVDAGLWLDVAGGFKMLASSLALLIEAFAHDIS